MRRINVLQFICPVGFYGAERWILALANHLDGERVRCDLAVTKESEKQNLEIVNRYEAPGGKTFQLPMKGRFDPGVISQLCKVIREREIDIIHTHGYKSDILGLIAAKMTGIRSVSTPHGFENSTDLKLQLFIKAGCFSLKFFDRVVPLSEQLLEDVKKLGIRSSKVVFIQNGVDLKEIEGERRKKDDDPPREEKRIGFIGQMISRKNIPDILTIFDSLCQKHDNLRLLLLGDGIDRKGLEEKAAKLPSASKIEFLGFRNDRLEQLRCFDLFVMTSSLEGIPRCLMEAMAMEIPVAAYDIPGIDQLIHNGKTGLAAKFGDRETLEAQWEKLLFDPSRAREIAAGGRDYVLEHFSAGRMAREYSELFEKLI